MVLVLDSSGSLDNTELGQMKSAMNSFVAAFLPETPTQIAVIDFDNQATVTQGFTNNETSLNTAINAVTSGGFTNWDDALYDARNLFPNRAANPDLVVFATDGNPTARYGHTPNPVYETGVAEYLAMAAAVNEADLTRAAGARIITLGIGNGLNTNNLLAISGPGATYTSGFDTLATSLSDLA
jgi:Mg-chelatase subunit ChlD